MAEEALETQASAEEKVADMIFGREEEPKAAAPIPRDLIEEAEEIAGDGEVDEVAEGDDREVLPVEEGEEPDMVEFEFNGKLYEAPAELKDAVLRQQDYTQKTQEVASQRKEVETALGAVEQQRQQYEFATSVQPQVIEAQQLEAQAEQYQQYLRDNLETLSSTEIERLRLAISDAREGRDNIVNEVHNKTTEFQQAQEQSRVELLNKGTEVLKQKIPGWGEESQKQLRTYAVANGFTEQEVASLIDPRQVETLWKASQYDSLQAGKTAAVKTVQNAPSIKPKARDPKTGKFVAKDKLQKTLKSTAATSMDKERAVENHIAERFNM